MVVRDGLADHWAEILGLEVVQVNERQALRRTKQNWSRKPWPEAFYALRISRRELSRHGPPRLHENHAEVFVSDYSYRNATMGSTLAARRAGM